MGQLILLGLLGIVGWFAYKVGIERGERLGREAEIKERAEAECERMKETMSEEEYVAAMEKAYMEENAGTPDSPEWTAWLEKQHQNSWGWHERRH